LPKKSNNYYNKFRNKEWLEEQYIKLQKSFSVICKEIDISENLLSKWFTEFNISKRVFAEVDLDKSRLYKNKEWLENQYVNNKKSCNKIAKELNCDASIIPNWLRKYDIPIRTNSESHIGLLLGDKNPMKREEVRSKFRGPGNRMNNPEIKEKYLIAIHTEEYYRHKIEGMSKYYLSHPELHEILSIKRSGCNNPNWRGGLSYEPYCPKWTPELRERIRAFFNYECIVCGKSQEENKRKLCCHHVEYNKNACCDGKPVHFAALCMVCHSKTNGNRKYWEYIIHRIIDEIYNGRSYYTKEEYENLKIG
jgi:transposase-like protein